MQPAPSNVSETPEQIESLISACKPHLSPESLANVSKWLTDEAYSDFRREIASQIRSGAWTELEDSFYTSIPFGTGGRRGPRGTGPNRINRRTIAESARGLADWVARGGESAKQRGIVIACDTRHGSPEFSHVCAQAIAAAGIKVYLFESFRPTPELSFAVTYLDAQAGVMVSASHNPPSDNGFKAYASDGGQLVPPDDAEVMACVQQAGLGAIPLLDFEEGKRNGLIRMIGDQVDRAYQKALSRVLLTNSREVRIVYSPLHGVGATAALPALRSAGFANVHSVEEQSFPSGDFPNVPNNIPNPEVPSAMEMSKALAEKIDADIAIATDPDADRLGCVAKRTENGKSSWSPLSGNQIGAILCHFVLTELQNQNRLASDSLVVRTTVTTQLIDRIAGHFGVGLISELLVGFKYIASVINSLDDPNRFVFGTEESHGYLSRPHTHDKDGINAALLLSEAAAKAKSQGRDLWTVLDEIYRQFGYYCELLENYARPGKSGQQEIAAMIDRMRQEPPTQVGGFEVVRVVDRLREAVYYPKTGSSTAMEPIKDPKTGEVIQPLTLAKDNLLIFHLAGNDRVDGGVAAIRPSGTEPKCKFYIAANARVEKDASADRFEQIKRDVNSAAEAIKSGLLSHAQSLV